MLPGAVSVVEIHDAYETAHFVLWLQFDNPMHFDHAHDYSRFHTAAGRRRENWIA